MKIKADLRILKMPNSYILKELVIRHSLSKERDNVAAVSSCGSHSRRRGHSAGNRNELLRGFL